MKILATLLLLGLVLIEAYCVDWLVSYAKERSDQRTEARREAYRKEAYKDMYIRLAISQSRKELWESVTKGGTLWKI